MIKAGIFDTHPEMVIHSALISFQNMYGQWSMVCEAHEQIYWSSSKWWRTNIVSPIQLIVNTIFLGSNFSPLAFLCIDPVGSGVISRLGNFWVWGLALYSFEPQQKHMKCLYACRSSHSFKELKGAHNFDQIYHNFYLMSRPSQNKVSTWLPRAWGLPQEYGSCGWTSELGGTQRTMRTMLSEMAVIEISFSQKSVTWNWL